LEMMENAMVFQLESLKIKPWVLFCFCVRFLPNAKYDKTYC